MSKENTCSVEGVDLFRWEPRKPLPLRPRRYFKWTKQLPFAPKVQNFGDLLSEDVVRYVVQRNGLKPLSSRGGESPQRLLAIGSIIQFLEPGDVVWGSGVNGKHLHDLSRLENITITAVRGPKSQELLQEVGYEAPSIYGDPGLLAPYIFDQERLRDHVENSSEVTLIPNLNDLPQWQAEAEKLGESYRLVTPIGTPEAIIKKIVNSQSIVTSSLHGFILAEAYGIPRALVASGAEPLFKYEDYFLGTGRGEIEVSPTISSAVSKITDEKLNYDVAPLLGAFPNHMWSS